MKNVFDSDPYPGKPRVLFVGYSESSHTHAWVDLLEGAEMNVRLFALPTGVPPDSWKVRTYITSFLPCIADPSIRVRLYKGQSLAYRAVRKIMGKIVTLPTVHEQAQRWLARIICDWRPQIVHTLGLDAAGFFFEETRRKYGLDGSGKWVLQLRGGSDLALAQHDPALVPRITHALNTCDQLLSDNRENFAIAARLGMPMERVAAIAPVPGTGGVDIDFLARAWSGPPSSRRLILWPKAYECPWSKALPVLEALTLVWDRIQPCEVYMLAATPDVEMWFRALPETMRAKCHLRERIPRQELLELMPRARVLLAPSLVDGTPNSLFEAMACGAFPIVSPLKTITPIVSEPQNVLFARNLYPEDIARALVRALSDDKLVNLAGKNNLALVRDIADRSKIRARVIEYYEALATTGSGTRGDLQG